MRLHRLQVQAFGPFAGTEEVDFDSLTAPGLFLLHGPTGAGKTSVLDAVCFALYGQVPGARASGRSRLRSDHAAPDTPPQVVLELTVGGRRLEVTRSPEWQRPKRRGAGTTREPASTDVRELVDGHWQVLVGRRSDEAGLLLRDLLGMGLEQFTKVVLLPQGEFATFLRASAEQRSTLLGHLFSVDRFSAAESWLREERHRLAGQVAQADAARDALLARAHEAMAPITSAAEGDDELALASPQAVDLVTGLSGSATVALGRAEHHAEQARNAFAAAQADLAAATERAHRASRRVEVAGQLAALQDAAGAHETAVERLATARRAEPLRLALVAAQEAQQAVTELGRRHAERQHAWTVALRPRTSSGPLDALRAECQIQLSRIEDAKGLEAELASLRSRVAAMQAQAASARIALAGSDTACSQSEADIDRWDAEVHICQAGASDLPAAERAVADAETASAAATAAATCAAELHRLTQEQRAAQDAELSARDHLLNVRERRLEGIAAELALSLVDGEPCSVCGSAEHPRPARSGAGHVDRAAETAAREQHEAAVSALEAARDALAHTTARREALQVAAQNLDTATALGKLKDARSRLTLAQQLQARFEGARAALASARSTLGQHQKEFAGWQEELTTAATTLQELAPQVTALHSRVMELGGEDPDLAARASRLTSELAHLDALREARTAHETAVLQHDAARDRLLSAAARAGFETIEAVRHALLDAETQEQLAASVAAYDRARADVAAVLASPDLAIDDAPPPDLTALEAAAHSGASTLRTAEHQLAVTLHAERSLRRLSRRLADHELLHADLRARWAQVEELSRCVDGTGASNALRMRLSAYVLAARLEQVAAAASERLLTMSDGRYTLVHSDELAKGGARSGLGLQVVDGWTGTSRETGTLSGGEAFLASLALALGLADVVQAEAAGTSVETLFVDEGFGTLDEQTLEEVMTVLDGLREGGRAVGLVSHVADLRDRITSRLEVRKTRNGSSLHHHGDASPDCAKHG